MPHVSLPHPFLCLLSPLCLSSLSFSSPLLTLSPFHHPSHHHSIIIFLPLGFQEGFRHTFKTTVPCRRRQAGRRRQAADGEGRKEGRGKRQPWHAMQTAWRGTGERGRQAEGRRRRKAGETGPADGAGCEKEGGNVCVGSLLPYNVYYLYYIISSLSLIYLKTLL